MNFNTLLANSKQICHNKNAILPPHLSGNRNGEAYFLNHL
jgi:hypothetical protein